MSDSALETFKEKNKSFTIENDILKGFLDISNDVKPLMDVLDKICSIWSVDPNLHQYFNELINAEINECFENNKFSDSLKNVLLNPNGLQKFITLGNEEHGNRMKRIYVIMHRILSKKLDPLIAIEFVKRKLKTPDLPQDDAVQCADILHIVVSRSDLKSDESKELLNNSLLDLLKCESPHCWCDKYIVPIESMILLTESFSVQSIEDITKVLHELGKVRDPPLSEYVDKIHAKLIPKIEGAIDILSQKFMKLVLDDASSEYAMDNMEMESSYSYQLLRIINFDKISKSSMTALKKQVIPILSKNDNMPKCLCTIKLLNYPSCK